MMDLSGVYPPVATPFVDENLAPDRLTANLQRLNRFDLSGYVVLGSNGENVMLSESEALQVIETAVETAASGKRIIFGAGAEYTGHAVDFIREASRRGGQCSLVLSPHYYKSQMSESVLSAYFLEVAEASPVPILIYNVPAFSAIQVPLSVLEKVGSHPNVIGMKDSSGNLTYQQNVLAMELENFQLLTGTANTIMPSMVMGAVGAIPALANIAPGHCVELYSLVRSGQLETAKELQLRLIRLNQLTTQVYGIGGLKCALDHAGFYGGLPRRPLLLPDKKGQRDILDELRKLDLAR